MTVRPKVSVSILTYNQAGIIGDAIDSVLMQDTDFDVEIRIGDDFSTDGTRSILETYRRRYPDRIFLNLQSDRSTGIVGRTNNLTNLRSCRGDYVAMLDGDDFWTDKNKLQIQANLLDTHPELSGTAHDAYIANEAGVIDENWFFSEGLSSIHAGLEQATLADVLLLPAFQTSTFMFRRNALLPFPQWMDEVPAGDWAIFSIVASQGPIHIQRRPMSAYRRHAASIISKMTEGNQIASRLWTQQSFRMIGAQFPDEVKSIRWVKRSLDIDLELAFAKREVASLVRSIVAVIVEDPKQTVPLIRRCFRYLAKYMRAVSAHSLPRFR